MPDSHGAQPYVQPCGEGGDILSGELALRNPGPEYHASEALPRPREVPDRVEGAAECEEGRVSVSALLVANDEAPKVIEAREGALNYLAVPPEPNARVDATPRDPDLDPSLPELLAGVGSNSRRPVYDASPTRRTLPFPHRRQSSGGGRSGSAIGAPP